MACILDEYEPYWCETDCKCKDCPNWVEEEKKDGENNN
jgi:hypothetical protein